jgi:hypothetical protein
MRGTEIVYGLELFKTNDRRAPRRALGRDRAPHSTQPNYRDIIDHV